MEKPAFASARPSSLLVGGVGLLAIASIPTGAVLAQAGAPFTVAETGQSYNRLQQAVNAIGAGRGTIRIASGVHRQCAVQMQGSISFEAAEPGKAIFDTIPCEGKAALVLRGTQASVTGLVFQNLVVSDGNGGGIRLEAGALDVSQSWFKDSQTGILTVNERPVTLKVDKSTFTRLGKCRADGGCSHSLYAGQIGELTVTRTRFEEGLGGHYLKSRASNVTIAGNSFDDARGKQTNYLIDLPEGATGTIENNWFVQGQDKENWSAFIALGAEGRGANSSGLTVTRNDARLAPGVDRNTIFLADWSGDRPQLVENRIGSGLEPYERR